MFAVYYVKDVCGLYLLRLPLKGGVIAWERGRPARMLSLWPPLSFSAMLQAATLSAATAAAKP